MQNKFAKRVYAFLALLLIFVLLAGSVIVANPGLYYYWLDKRPIISYPREIVSQESESGEISLVDVIVKNNGNDNLEVDNISTSCGCMSVAVNDVVLESPKSHFDIAASERLKITLKFRVEGNFGISRVLYLRFQTNDPLNLNCETTILVPFVNKGVVFVPPKISMPTMRPGESKERIVNVYETKNPSRTFSHAEASNTSLKIQFTPKEQVKKLPDAPDEFHYFLGQLRITAVGSNIGNSTDRVRFFLSERLEKPSALEVDWKVSKDIEVAPESLVFRKSQQSVSTADKSVLCFSPFGESFVINSITCPSWLSVDFNSLAKSKSHKLVFKVKDIKHFREVKNPSSFDIAIKYSKESRHLEQDSIMKAEVLD